ncbi:uncharacterized protein LOC135121394 [Zophobas morio]|uniref:uncharacterized protein LOC135121394 n=1 Tax=Zophobas morio TaxID=2755281 RepID=UPI003083E320
MTANIFDLSSKNNETEGYSKLALNSKASFEYDEAVKKDKKKGASFSPIALLSFTSILLTGCFLYFGRPELDSLNPNESSISPVAFANRAWRRLNNLYYSFAAPSENKLLPDKNPELPPYTLLIEIDDVLIKTEWTTEHGWRVKKRPGAVQFLNYLCQFYEIVLFTSSSAMSAAPYVAVLNKYGTVSYALYRDSTRYENFTFIKDLRYLNRDLSKVVLVDTDESHYAFTPENGLCLPRWDGSADDKTLIELLPFFEALALSDLGDLRPTLSHYAGKDFHSEFIKNQRLLKLQEKETLQKNKDRVERWSFSSLWPSRRNFREAESLVKSVEDEVLAFEKKKKEELQQQKKIPN